MTGPEEKSHVHFGAECESAPQNKISVQDYSNGCVHVHLGFLQLHHQYVCDFDVPKSSLLNCTKDNLLRALENTIPSIYSRILSLEDCNDVINFSMEFYAGKEKLIRDELKLQVNGETTLKLVMNARVLGVGKGTPLLKDGIKYVGVNTEDMSEVSDWTGFD